MNEPTKRLSHPESTWEWYGRHGHFICGEWCRFHLCTKVGSVLVSTVGMLVSPKNSGGSELSDAKYLRAHPNGDEVGYNRHYETMVFGISEMCDCGCGMPSVDPADERGMWPANDQITARKNHMEACYKFAANQRTKDKP